jgi:hypothetical protein
VGTRSVFKKVPKISKEIYSGNSLPLFEDESPLSRAVDHLDIRCREIIVAGAESERELDNGLNGRVRGSIEFVTERPVRNPVAVLEIFIKITTCREHT